MTSTQDTIKSSPGLLAAFLAFAVFMALLIGTYMTWRDRPDAGAHTGDAGTASRIEQVTVMGRSLESSRTSDFRRAEMTAVMGHGTLDLREADIQGREAVVEAFVLMGHANILVPESWTVDAKEMIIVGGLNDHTRHEGADPEKKLRIEGAVLMGALTVSH